MPKFLGKATFRSYDSNLFTNPIPKIMLDEATALTVSELNQQMRAWLEASMEEVKVLGEVSNLSRPASGHLYFILKDASAQLRCVYFRNYQRSQSKLLSDGQQVIVQGKLTLYEARGEYQLTVYGLTETGYGLLYQQFEALKAKLQAQGLFAAEKKRALPTYPTTIGVITSSSGAALQDILTTLAQRFPLAHVRIYASEVQGLNAAPQLCRAIQQANAEQQAEVLILARGGGSIEDLWAFNDEKLAYTMANSKLPIITGIGHETDFTIADFVADWRAATPTAAAKAATPDRKELINHLMSYANRIERAVKHYLQQKQWLLSHCQLKLLSPEQMIYNQWQRLDYLEKQLTQQLLKILTKLKQQFATTLTTLHIVSPLATLDRGYAIATCQQKILFDSGQVHPGNTIEVRLAKGYLVCDVKEAK